MRLTEEEVGAIRAAAREAFGAGAVVRVFGSRADDARRGGDLDLHVETGPGGGTIEAEARFRDAIGPALDDLKVDIVFRERGGPLRPIDEIAYREGIAL
jgi:hypothetical protein